MNQNGPFPTQQGGYNWNGGTQNAQSRLASYQQATGQVVQSNTSPLEQMVRPVLSGRIIQQLNEITPQEVPMDGSVSLFPQNDYSCIYAKAWNSQGGIDTVKYVPEKIDHPNDQNGDQWNAIFNRLDRIEQMLNNQTYKRKPHYNNSKKKEVTENA